MKAALKTLISNAVEDCFLTEQRNLFTEYLGVTARQLMEQLMQLYGNITASNMNTKKAHMEGVINTTQLIEIYFKIIYDVIQFSADGNTLFTTKKPCKQDITPLCHLENTRTPERSGKASTSPIRHGPTSIPSSPNNTMDTTSK